MPTAFEVIAEPHRRRILDLLLSGPRPVGELTGLLGLTQPGTSRHLRVLREAGLVRVRVEAQRRWYELEPGPLAEIVSWLEPYRRMWAGQLDRLEDHLAAAAGGAPAGPTAAGQAGVSQMLVSQMPASETAVGETAVGRARVSQMLVSEMPATETEH